MRRALALILGLMLAQPAAAALGPGCGAPTEWLQSPPLRATATGIATGRLRILAVGSASVSGPGVSTPAAAWPARLEALLRERRPDLVLPLDDLAGTLAQGLDRLHARGIDAVVMGIQFSRFLRANAEVDPYRDALRIVAAAAHAGFFSRRTAEIDKLNDCLARALGAFIRDGVDEARR